MRGFPRALALAVFVLPALSVVTPAAAQTYPSRPVHILRWLGPGSSGDVVSRSIAAPMKSIARSAVCR